MKSGINFEHFDKKVDAHRFCNSEIRDFENLLRKMSREPRFILYHTHWLLGTKFLSKRSGLLTCQILGLLLNTLPTDEKYPVLNRGNLTTSIQMQLSQKQKTFSQFFPAFFESSLIFVCFEKKMTLAPFVFLKLRTLKTWLDKCLKSRVS